MPLETCTYMVAVCANACSKFSMSRTRTLLCTQVLGPRETGAPLVHLLGIESPGITASMALAEHVASLLSPAAL